MMKTENTALQMIAEVPGVRNMAPIWLRRL